MNDQITTAIEETEDPAFGEIGLEISINGGSHAAEEIGKVADAFERLNAELEKMSAHPHGGISMRIYGEMVTLDIKPA